MKSKEELRNGEGRRGLTTAPCSASVDYNKTQLYAGKASHAPDRNLWATDTLGHYWCGYTNHRSPKELMDECVTTIADLLRNHPELRTPNNTDHKHICSDIPPQEQKPT